MSKFITTLLFFLIFTKLIAQQNSLIVPLNQLGRDERFDKFIVTMPVFLTIDDTIHTMDFEGTVAPQKLKKNTEGIILTVTVFYFFQETKT